MKLPCVPGSLILGGHRQGLLQMDWVVGLMRLWFHSLSNCVLVQLMAGELSF